MALEYDGWRVGTGMLCGSAGSPGPGPGENIARTLWVADHIERGPALPCPALPHPAATPRPHPLAPPAQQPLAMSVRWGPKAKLHNPAASELNQSHSRSVLWLL